MRVDGERFRLDVTRGRSTAVLVYGRRGVVSCQIVQPKAGSRRQGLLPRGQDPDGGCRPSSTRRSSASSAARHSGDLAAGASSVTVRRAGTWQAPRRPWAAECFAVQGQGRRRTGTYCYLLEAGSDDRRCWLARSFPSGTLELREVKSRATRGAVPATGAPDAAARPG